MNILESSTHSGCQLVINEIEHQRSLLMDLHDLILPILDPYSRQKKHAQQLFQDIFSSSSKVISFLELGDNSYKQANLIKHRRKGGKNNVDSTHVLAEEAKEIGNKRSAQHTGSVVTQAPHFDGYQWRKYGQKWISKAKHSRSYYRCANNKDQGCLATKTVQQKESDGGAAGTVRLFDVDYYGQHVCKKDDIIHPYIVEATHYSAPIATHNQSSSSSSTFVHNDVLGIQDENFEGFFMVPSTPEYLIDFTDIDMAEALEVTSVMIPEDIWA